MQLSAHLHPDYLVEHRGHAFTPARWGASTQPKPRTAVQDHGRAHHHADWPSLCTCPWRCTRWLSLAPARSFQARRKARPVPVFGLSHSISAKQATITPSIMTPWSRRGRSALRPPASGTIRRGRMPYHYQQLLRAVPWHLFLRWPGIHPASIRHPSE